MENPTEKDCANIISTYQIEYGSVLEVSIPSRLFPGLSPDVFWSLLKNKSLKISQKEKLEVLLDYRKKIIRNLHRLQQLS